MSSWYAKVIESTGKITGAYSGSSPELQDTQPGEVFIHVDHRPVWNGFDDGSEDRFVDMRTHEMYKEVLGDRRPTAEDVALQEIVGPPVPKSRVIRRESAGE